MLQQHWQHNARPCHMQVSAERLLPIEMKTTALFLGIIGRSAALVFVLSPLLLLLAGCVTCYGVAAESRDLRHGGRGNAALRTTRFGFSDALEDHQQRRLQTGVAANVVLSESSVSVAEGGVEAVYAVILDADPGTEVTINLVAGSGALTATPPSLSFTTLTWSTSQSVTVAAVDDDVVDGLTEVDVTHSVVIADSGYVWTGVFTPSETVIARVYDDDTAGVLLSLSALYVDEDSIATYTVALMGSPSDNVEVTAAAGNAYLTVSTSMPLTFTPGSWESAQTVTVRAVDDAVQTAESYTSAVSHTTVSNDADFDSSAVLYFPGSEVDVTIYDNDDGCYRSCDPGYYASPCNGTTECSACSPGYYCAGACANPVACPAGAVLTSYGGILPSECTTCPDGFYSSEEGSGSCSLCSAGYACSSTNVVSCDPGYYSSAGATLCSECPDGYYNSLSAQESCRPCPAGYQCSDKVDNPLACSPGSYSIGNSTVCSVCPAGYFCSSTGSSPALCEEGSYSLSNWAYCVVCPAGHYCINTNEIPTECPPGTASVGGSSFCTSCLSGTYAATNGSTACTNCPAGYSCLDMAAAPVACENGTFSHLGDGYCTRCDAGTYSLTGASGCLACPLGKSCFDPANDPIWCQVGYYSEGGQVLTCSVCEPGTYTTSSHDRCVACSAGYECPDPSLGPALCNDGFYSTNGSIACTECPAGSFCTAPYTLPQPCSAGTYSVRGSINCTICPGGYSCSTPSALPVACNEGEYSAGGASACLTCPAGSYCPGPPYEEDSIQACPPGRYSPGGTSLCSECPKGYYCPDASQVPEACPDGYFADAGNQTSCDRCTAGFYCPSAAMPEQACMKGFYSLEGASECTECQAGFGCYSTSSSPVPCDPGTFSAAGFSNCTSCSPGYYCPFTDSTEQYECPQGTYSTGGATSCVGCSPGYYCPHTTQALEVPCRGGYFASGGAENCTACPGGFACNAEGTSMIVCESGYYSAAGAADCVACPAGKYCPFTDQDIVLECPSGHYSEGVLSECVACEAGYYCPYLDSPETLPCLSGSFAVGGEETCTECPAGFTCSSTATNQMTACGEGYYSLLGEPLCTACPEGFWCPYPDDSPLACNPGTYSSTASLTCTSCPAGYFCDDPAASPQPCEVGYYSGGGVAVCSACTPGYQCPEASVGATPAGSACPEGTYCNPARTLTECPAGTFGNVTAAASEAEGCQPCTEGYYCSDTGNTLASRKICPAAYYCPLGSSSPTACAAGLYNSLTGSWSVDDCAACTPGYYCTKGSDSGQAAICPAGHYCPASTPSGTAYACPAGTYSAATGLADSSGCMNCTRGAYCPEGSTAATKCTAGSYSPYTSAMAASACLACEVGWACPSTGMYQMTTRCGTGSYCPLGTSSRKQYSCAAGTYTDQTNLTMATQCTVCPGRKACPIGSTSTDWTSCAPGYYCPEGTPAADSFPCPAGYFTNRTDLASADECYPCPLGHFCGGGGSIEADGPCAAGYYCPLATGGATDFPCPAGTFSDSTSLYLKSQCDDCPPGYYCPEASIQIEHCPAGTYSPYNATQDAGPDEYPSCTTCPAGSYCKEASVEPVPCGTGLYSDDGADNCTVCETGHYCGSNETPALAMYTGGGSWENNADDAGQCFNGTYCAAGMNRAPDLLRDSCPAGHYCPAAATSPIACPSGTYNPHEGMDDEDDCQVSTPGYYTIEAATDITGMCAPGYYCPAGSTGPQQVPCPARYYRTDEGGASLDDCALCVSGGYCPSGSTQPLDCLRGYYCVTGVVDPEPCPLGTYGNTTGNRQITDCINCSPGYYCDQRGLTNPAGLCDPGYYCLDGSYTSAPSAPGSPLSADDSDIGGLCPAGGYCPIGSSFPQPCPSGTFNNYSGASTPADCTGCPPGYYCSGTSNPSPTGSCLSGYYCTGGASTSTQYNVEPGYFSDPGASQQYPCLPGTYNHEAGRESCLECLSGYYCPEYATTEPIVCPAGSYCPEGSDVDELCPGGTYSPTLGLDNVTQCTDCNPGKYCATNGLTAVSGSCEAGFYCTSGAVLSAPVGQSYGGLCLAGHFCEEATGYPEPCPLGTYYGGLGNDGDVWYNNTITGDPFRTYCFLCSATHACNSTGLTAPDNVCGAGYFCKLGATSPTPYCEAGEGLCDYGICPVGHYCATGTADPITCPPGTYMNNTGAAECFTCPEGYYCDGTRPTEFVECPAGRYCPLGTDASIPNCPSGAYSAQTGLSSNSDCTDCTPGQYCGDPGLTAPDGTCEAGYFCPPGSKNSHGETDTETENVCPAGRYCVAGVGTPALCPVRTFNPSEGTTAEEDCVPCSAGQYCETNGLQSPTGGCYSGHYCKRGVAGAAPTEGTYFVSTMEYGGDYCPVGTYCPNGTDTPLPCEAGMYNDLEGQEACFACPAGFYCEASSTEYESSPCPLGYYCLEGTRYAQEYPCPPGTYANTAMTSSLTGCVDAPAGWYVAGSASTDVTGSCEEGFYCTGGSSSATPFCVETSEGTCETGGPCVPGEYCPEGSPYPQACPGGSYCADSSGQINGNCFAGYYCTQGSWTPAPENGADSTVGGEFIGDICPQGHYCPTGSIAPRACASSTYSPSTGNMDITSCLPCEPGFMCPYANTSIPTEPCPAGFYCPAGTAEATLQCGAGTSCPESSWEPTDCEAGTHQPSTGQTGCLECPAGYFCVSGASEPTDCPAGSYCPNGTLWGTQFLCPNGTYSDTTNLVEATECTPCSPGSYCFERGLASPTGLCDEGFYCNTGAVIATPDSSSSVGYTGDTCIDRTNGTANDVCPIGHYCPTGSAAPIPCPPGTTSATFGLTGEAECLPCEPGFYCPENGAFNSTVECLEGFYCPGGDAYPTSECTLGHYCPVGSAAPINCLAGTFQNDTGASECDLCPAGYYCESGAAVALACLAGNYCPEASEFGSQFPCPNGMYSEETGLAASNECYLCAPGRFCGSEGLTEPEGLCGPGFYCALGAKSPMPSGNVDSTVGGMCAAGYACVESAESPRPVDGTTGYECPQGTYCPAGSSAPLGCPPGTYNPSKAMGSCTQCPSGYLCSANATAPAECPVYRYCPAGSWEGIPCPLGTHGARTDLQSANECAACPAGHYCIDGNITSTCRAGYFCKTGAGTPTPNSEFAGYSYDVYNDMWEALDAGPCPAGHFCPVATEDPVQCENATVRVALLGVSSDDCGVCPPGYVCFPGEAVPEQCYRGYYCPQGEDPVACPRSTYNPNLEQDDQDDCFACPAGYFCDSEGIGDYSQYPCPAGHYCLAREDDPVECPSGRYQNRTGAASVEECNLCPGGFQCGAASINPEVCPRSTYCPGGSFEAITCTAGFYCPTETTTPIICPPGYYCPLGSSEPTLCVLGTYCPEGSEIYTSCPLGWYGSTTSNNTLFSRDDACDECPPGTYGADPDRLVCKPCPAGYVCLGTTISAAPASAEDDGGYVCPAGHYCPEGSSVEIACEPGSRNALTGSVDASACLLCAADLYQDQGGSSSCLPCSSSSTSFAGSTECFCLGLNRAFQLSDGQCICRSGYEYYDETGLLESAVDGSVDCQPIVYDRCYTGEALDVDGDCLSESDCETRCGDVGGQFFEHIGLCECYGLQNLNEVCDATCRDSAAVMFVDPTTGLVIVINGNKTEYVDSADMPGFAGVLYCTSDAGCNLFPVTVGANFSGVYGTGDAVAAAAASGSTSRRRRYLEMEGEEDVGVKERIWNYGDDNDDESLKLPAPHAIKRFLTTRAESYRPRNPYRNRFDGNGMSLVGATPKAQRPSPRPREWEAATQILDDEAGSAGWEESGQKHVRRRLVDDHEPAVEHPLGCVGQGDSVLFDISSGCYPVYEKDSLLNSNSEFDYGEFRSVAELALSSATYSTFGFVFEEAGTYVLSSSCDAKAIFVLVVMPEDVSCTTDAHFVPLTAANLILLGVAKNNDNITLTPNWALIGGLLAGVAFMVLGVVSAVYYFRTKAWATGAAPIPSYRKSAQAGLLDATEDDARQRPGFFVRRLNKISPEYKAMSRPNSWRSGRFGRNGDVGGGDPEMPGVADSSSSTGHDDPNVRKLMDRLQQYHDVVEREFTGQKDLVMKLHHLLEQEADELKRLLGGRAGAMASQGSGNGVDEAATRAALSRLKTDMASRRLHEASTSASEVEALAALRRLQQLLREGAAPFAARVMAELAAPSGPDGQVATFSPLLREIMDEADLIKVEVVDELAVALDRDRHREHNARMLLEGAVQAGGVALSEAIVHSLRTMSEKDALTDTLELDLTLTLKRLADRLPLCNQELKAAEALILRNLTRIREMGNTALEDTERERGEKSFRQVLEQLIEALAVVGERADLEKQAADRAKIDAEVERNCFSKAVDESVAILGTEVAGQQPSSIDLQGMLKEIRNLVSTSTAAAVAAPTAAANALFAKLADQHGTIDDAASSDGNRVGDDVEARLRAAQDAGVAEVAATAEVQKRRVQKELEQAGATEEEREAMMNAVAEDQRLIEGVLEAERLRVEESLKAAAASRKARGARDAEEDVKSIDASAPTREDLLREQSAQMEELRQKHEEALLAVAVDMDDGENEAEEAVDSPDGNEAGFITALREVHAEHTALLEETLTTKAESAHRALAERLRAQRAMREAELIEKEYSAPEAAIHANDDLAASDTSQRQELTSALAEERSNASKAEASAQRQALVSALAAKDSSTAAEAVESEIRRVREEAAETLQRLEIAIADEAMIRRKALFERLKARRRGKEAELERRRAGEAELIDADTDLNRLEESEAEALEDALHAERAAALKNPRAQAAAAEVAAVAAQAGAAGEKMDPEFAIKAAKMKDLHLVAADQLERDLSRKETCASRALRERLLAARTQKQASLQEKDLVSALDAARRARKELEDGEHKERLALSQKQAADRLEALDRARMEAEGAAAGIRSMRDEADRLILEHRERNLELQKELKTDAERQRTTLQKRLVSRHRVAEAAAAESPPLSPQADAESIARTEAADQAERDALERELTSELSRAEDDSNAYESSLQEILSLSEEAVAKASGSSAEEAVRKAEAEAAQARHEKLRSVHERSIAAFEMQAEGKRRGAAARLAHRRAAATAASAEAMRAVAIDEQLVANKLAEEGARATAEALELDASLQTEGATMVAEERARQMLAVSADADPQKEAGRIRERHTHCLHALEKELDQHRRDQRRLLNDRLHKRQAAKKEALQRAGVGDEEVAEAMKAIELDGERDSTKLEEALCSLEFTQLKAAREASALAADEDDCPESGLAALRVQHQESEVRLKESLRSEAAARRARLRQRVARRVAESARELQEAGRSAEMIAAEEAAIRAAGDVEEKLLDTISKADAESRVLAARQKGIAEEAIVDARKDAARELRKNHENAAIELVKSLEDMKRSRREALAASLKERKAKRAAELKNNNSKKQDVAAELALVDQEAIEEQRQLEESLEEDATTKIETERLMLAKREAEVRAAQLTADTFKRAADAEVERLRQEHGARQRILEETLEEERVRCQRALSVKLARKRQEKLAAAETAASRAKVESDHNKEMYDAKRALETQQNREMLQALEESGQNQARAEMVARAASQTAIEDAEARARIAREKHEKSTKELEQELAKAKTIQGKRLTEKLDKKRKEREKQLESEGADAAAIKAAREKLDAEEARETAALVNHISKEKARLMADNRARAAARRAKEEAEVQEAAAETAAATAAAKAQAEDTVRKLQQHHMEQSAALELHMDEERKSREIKLRDRLAKKRLAKEKEMQALALSEEERKREHKRLEEAEKVERQHFFEEAEQEKMQRVHAQRKMQQDALAEAANAAARAAESAAAASARAAAAEAAREAVEAAEKDEFQRKAQKLKEASQIEQERAKLALAGQNATTKSKLAERLAKRKAGAEAARRDLEVLQKEEEERLREKHKAIAEAAAAAAAPGWSGDIAWDKAVAAAMSEPPRTGESQLDREARVLKSVLEAGIVPDNKIGKCVEAVMAGRHDAETSDLLEGQYKERAAKLASSLGALLAEKNKARAQALQRLLTNASSIERGQATAEVEDGFAGRQQQLEIKIMKEMEPIHLEKQLELRQKHLLEVAGTVRTIAPESALKRLQEMAAERQEEELQEYRKAMEREKEERIKRVKEERTKFEEDLRKRHEQEMRMLQEEDEKIMGVEKEAQEARISEKKEELERQRVEAQRRLEERSGQLNAKEKEALLEQFKKDQAAGLGALKAEGASQKTKLEQKLASRRQKKAEELTNKKAQEMKKKEQRDKEILQEFEKQAQVAAQAEATALAASQAAAEKGGDAGGLVIEIDQHAVKLARRASLMGVTNEAKEMLKKTLAASESRNKLSGQGSIVPVRQRSISVQGGAAAAAAASAAAGATAAAYTQIHSKLEGIEHLIAALKAAQSDSRLAGQPVGAAGAAEAYRDAEDSVTVPEGDDVQVIPRDNLPVQALTRLEFGEQLLNVLGLGDTVALQVANNLPPKLLARASGGGGGANAFRNSYMWDAGAGVLYVHVRRLTSSGDFGLVLVHAAAHIRVDPSDMSNDLDPRFTHHFHRSLKVLTQELFKYRGAAPAADGGLISGRTRIQRGNNERQESGGLSPRITSTVLKVRGSGTEEFAQSALAERLERYAKASGHPRLVELLSRHAKDQRDKFTLSDDDNDDEVSNADDADYMERFDRRDGDSILRSPIGSVNMSRVESMGSDVAGGEKQEEKSKP